MTSTALGLSDTLHDRVQSFIRQSLGGDGTTESFDALACDLARFQASCGTGLDRLLASRSIHPDSLVFASQIPAVPTDVFKFRRVACHTAPHDLVVFRTSGTTVGERGSHPLRTDATYRAAARAWGQTMLFPDQPALHWALLAPDCRGANDSSLGFMLDDLSSFCGAAVQWLVRDDRIDLDALRNFVSTAIREHEPVLIAGASFAFVHLLDALGALRLPLPHGSRVMQTGGFKGRTREVDSLTLRTSIARTFDVHESYVVSEYGMTELCSQAYEATLRHALGFSSIEAAPGVYSAPPWLRVVAVDPVSLAPLPPGHVGIARVEDLANVDSAVAVQTADRVREVAGGFELLGRMPATTPRGCSLGIDEILASTAPAFALSSEP